MGIVVGQPSGAVAEGSEFRAEDGIDIPAPCAPMGIEAIGFGCLEGCPLGEIFLFGKIGHTADRVGPRQSFLRLGPALHPSGGNHFQDTG